MAKNEGQIVIKKYANRRLYNTGTSTYVTLDDLAVMVKRGEDFVVQDVVPGGAGDPPGVQEVDAQRLVGQWALGPVVGAQPDRARAESRQLRSAVGTGQSDDAAR